MHLQVSRMIILPLLPAAVKAERHRLHPLPLPPQNMEPHPSVISSRPQTQDYTELFLSFHAHPPSASLPSLKHRRLFPPCPKPALAARTRNSSQKPRWRQMKGSCWEPAWVSVWEFALKLQQEGKAQGGAGAAALEVAYAPL